MFTDYKFFAGAVKRKIRSCLWDNPSVCAKKFGSMDTVIVERKKLDSLLDAFSECQDLLQTVYDGSLNKEKKDQRTAAQNALTTFKEKSPTYSEKIGMSEYFLFCGSPDVL